MEQDKKIELDTSLSELIKASKDENSVVLEQLKLRFFNELVLSIVFFLFSKWAQEEGSEYNLSNTSLDEKSPENKFFEIWQKEASKKIKKELFEINKKLKNDTFEYLNTISNYSLPSTEDYQFIYTEALKETRKNFEKATNQSR